MNLLLLLSLLIPLSLSSPPLHPSVTYRPTISEDARKLSGVDLTSFVNKQQKLWKAETSRMTFQEKMARVKDIKFVKSHEEKDQETENSQVLLDIPASFDSRQQWPGCSQIGTVRDQSDCGSAAHLVAVEIASDRTCIFSNQTFNWPLSAQDPLSCCVGLMSICGDGWGCDGSWPKDILKWWQTHGLCTGGNYYDQFGCKPYSIYPCDKKYPNGTTSVPCPGYHTPTCEEHCTSNITWPIAYKQDKHFGKAHYNVGKKMTDIQTEIMTNGPVIASFIIYEDFWDYKSGIYVHTAGDQDGGMDTKIIGWGVDNGVPYWLCVHQWGTDFGENGYVRILRGVNEVNIEHQVLAALPDLNKHN